MRKKFFKTYGLLSILVLTALFGITFNCQVEATNKGDPGWLDDKVCVYCRKVSPTVNENVFHQYDCEQSDLVAKYRPKKKDGVSGGVGSKGNVGGSNKVIQGGQQKKK